MDEQVIQIVIKGETITVEGKGQPPQSVASPEEALQLVGQMLGVEEEESDLGGPMPENGMRPAPIDRSSQQAAWDEQAKQGF